LISRVTARLTMIMEVIGMRNRKVEPIDFEVRFELKPVEQPIL
jgi:hypothetical protein